MSRPTNKFLGLRSPGPTWALDSDCVSLSPSFDLPCCDLGQVYLGFRCLSTYACSVCCNTALDIGLNTVSVCRSAWHVVTSYKAYT